MRPVIYAIGGGDRTLHIARSMRDGIRMHGLHVPEIRMSFDLVPEGDIAIAYGWRHERVFKAYPNYAYFDLGYWDRRPLRNKKDGYHRLAVNDWDTDVSMLVGMPGDRLAQHHIELKEWGSKGSSILLTGMSDKAAGTHGFRPAQWQRDTCAALALMTQRRVECRPKPTSERPASEPIERVLARSHMLVTHHSNTAVDALIAGVPYWCVKGVAKRCSVPALTPAYIDNPPTVDFNQRRQLLQDISYVQWRPSEMSSGRVWELIKWILRSL